MLALYKANQAVSNNTSRPETYSQSTHYVTFECGPLLINKTGDTTTNGFIL